MKKDGIYVIFDAKSDKMGRLADKKQNILLRAIVGKTPQGRRFHKQTGKGGYFYGEIQERGDERGYMNCEGSLYIKIRREQKKGRDNEKA